MSDAQPLDQATIDKAAAAVVAKAAKAEAKAKADQAKAEAKAIADAAKLEAKAKADQAKAEAKAAKDAELAEAAKAKETANAAKAAEKAAKVSQSKPKIVLVSQNGVTRPRENSLCGKIWAMADNIAARIAQPTPISILLAETTAAGLNAATTKTQYALWKTFNGVYGVVAKPATPIEETKAA